MKHDLDPFNKPFHCCFHLPFVTIAVTTFTRPLSGQNCFLSSTTRECLSHVRLSNAIFSSTAQESIALIFMLVASSAKTVVLTKSWRYLRTKYRAEQTKHRVVTSISVVIRFVAFASNFNNGKPKIAANTNNSNKFFCCSPQLDKSQ